MMHSQRNETLKRTIDKFILRYNQQRLNSNETVMMNHLFKEWYQLRYRTENE